MLFKTKGNSIKKLEALMPCYENHINLTKSFTILETNVCNKPEKLDRKAISQK